MPMNSMLTYSGPSPASWAFCSGMDKAVSNGPLPYHFAALREHYSEREIVQIVAVISLFGFLNRWNDTMATQLEASPVEFATQWSVTAGNPWSLVRAYLAEVGTPSAG